MVKEGIFQKISSLLKIETNPNIIVSCIRIVSAVCKNNLARVCGFNPCIFYFVINGQFYFLQVKGVLQFLGVPWLLDQLNSKNDDQISAAQYSIQTVINSLTGMNLKEGKQPDKELCDGEMNVAFYFYLNIKLY